MDSTALCAACRSVRMVKNLIHCYVSALYIPYGQRRAVMRKLYFCAQHRCLSAKRRLTNLITPPQDVRLDMDSEFTDDEIEKLYEQGIVHN